MAVTWDPTRSSSTGRATPARKLAGAPDPPRLDDGLGRRDGLRRFDHETERRDAAAAELSAEHVGAGGLAQRAGDDDR